MRENVREEGEEERNDIFQGHPIGDIQNFHKFWIFTKIQEEEVSCVIRVSQALSEESNEKFLEL